MDRNHSYIARNEFRDISPIFLVRNLYEQVEFLIIK